MAASAPHRATLPGTLRSRCRNGTALSQPTMLFLDQCSSLLPCKHLGSPLFLFLNHLHFNLCSHILSLSAPSFSFFNLFSPSFPFQTYLNHLSPALSSGSILLEIFAQKGKGAFSPSLPPNPLAGAHVSRPELSPSWRSSCPPQSATDTTGTSPGAALRVSARQRLVWAKQHEDMI